MPKCNTNKLKKIPIPVPAKSDEFLMLTINQVNSLAWAEHQEWLVLD